MKSSNISPYNDIQGLAINGGTGGLTLNSNVTSIPQNTTMVNPGGMTISGDASQATPATIVVSNGSTVQCSNISSSGGVNPVAITAKNGLTTPALSITGSTPGFTTQNMVCQGDCSVAGNFSSRNLVFDMASVANLAVTDTLTAANTTIGGPLQINSDINLADQKALVLGNNGYIGASGGNISVVGSTD